MKTLTQKNKREIAIFDSAQERRANITRFYKYLVQNRGDLEIHTVAVKSRKDGTAAVKEVVRASALSKRVLVKDMVITFMSGYNVDWSPEHLGPAKSWTYEGRWGVTAYDPKRNTWKLRAPIINPEVIEQTPAFRWCAYTDNCGDILDYLKTYLLHPKAELLAKTGAGHLAKSRSFLSRLEKKPALARFVASNIAGIAKTAATIPVIQKAYAERRPVEDVQKETDNAQFLKNNRIPETLCVNRVLKYLSEQKITAEQYSAYLEDLKTLRIGLTDTKNAYPKDFAERSAAIMEQAASAKRRADKAAERRLNARILAVAKMLRQAEQTPGPFAVRFPRNELDLIREGRVLTHCVGDGRWAERIAKQSAYVAFIRKPDAPETPFVTVAYSPKEHRIEACYGQKNGRPDDAVLSFVHGPFKDAVERAAKTA